MKWIDGWGIAGIIGLLAIMGSPVLVGEMIGKDWGPEYGIVPLAVIYAAFNAKRLKREFETRHQRKRDREEAEARTKRIMEEGPGFLYDDHKNIRRTKPDQPAAESEMTRPHERNPTFQEVMIGLMYIFSLLLVSSHKAPVIGWILFIASSVLLLQKVMSGCRGKQ